MSEKNGSAGKRDLDELRADIRLTRAELGETVQALAAKADVKARAREQVEQTKQRIKEQAAGAIGRGRAVRDDPVEGSVEAGSRRIPLPLVLAGVVALAGIILVVRGRRR